MKEKQKTQRKRPHNRDLEILKELARVLLPRPKITPVQAAEDIVMLSLPGGYYGKWDADVTPQMREPLNMLASRRHEALIYVGPAQSGKTQALVDCWVAYIASVAVADAMVVQPTMDGARDFSKRRIDRLIRHSPKLKKLLRHGRHGDNIYDKQFNAGNILSLAWPSVSQLSGKPIKYMALTDYDRMPADVDGEGTPFGLSRKRTTTFMTGGMTMAESSPGGVILDPKWSVTSPHEAPPTRGILALYNDGDRRRWYWPCPDCNEYFMSGPGLKGVYIPEEGDITERAAKSRIICPTCASAIEPKHKAAMNARGVWVPDGMTVDKNGKLRGPDPRSTMLSYWQDGLSAAFQSLDSIVANYLRALRQYETTGSEESLKTTVNVDQSMAYLPRRSAQARAYDPLMERREHWEKRAVPDGVRFLIAAVDIQASKFAVMVLGFGIDQEMWLVDRFDLKFSPRGQDVRVEPATYIEDWEILRKHVIQKRYPLDDDSGRDMGIRAMGYDTGGADGVTDNAYAFWRGLKRDRLHKDVFPLKGESRTAGARIKLTYPEASSQRQRGKIITGALVPVLMINANMIKDASSATLNREEPGPGYLHFPLFLGKSFFEELTAEEKDNAGKWVNAGNRPNESWDLLGYCKAIALHIGIEKIKWKNPSQGWALPWDRNALVAKISETTEIIKKSNESDATFPQIRQNKPARPAQSNWLGRPKGSWL